MWVISRLAKELFASHISHCCTHLTSYTKLHASTFHNLQKLYHKLFFPMMLRPDVHHSLLIHDISRSNTTTHHSQYDSFGRVISLSQRLLPDNTQQSLQIRIHTPSRIQGHNLSRQAARNPCLRMCSHQDRQHKH